MTDDRRDCETIRDLLALAISTDAAVAEVAQAKAHLEQCGACLAYLRELQGDERRLADFAADHEARVSELRLAAVNALADPPVRSAAPRNRWRRMASFAMRPAVAATAAAAVLILLVFAQGPDGSFDAWAEVVATVRQATSSQFRLKDMSGSNVEARQSYSAQGTAHRTYEDGELVEGLYVDFERREMLYLAYPLQIGARITFAPEMLDDFRQHDPGETFDFLQEYAYENLGRRRIDGHQAVGIRIADARFLAQRMEHAELELWVDPDTKLPIRFDVTGDVAGGTRSKHVRFYDFRWNEPLPADEFRPHVPADFKISAGVHLQVDEQHCLAGLDLFAEVVGRYPSSLAYESLKVELWRSDGARRQDVGAMVLDMFRIRLASDFYGELVTDERQVLYFGHDVRPGEGQRILMRWQEPDGRYRVVYGDLRAETVDANRLLELEGQR